MMARRWRAFVDAGGRFSQRCLQHSWSGEAVCVVQRVQEQRLPRAQRCSGFQDGLTHAGGAGGARPPAGAVVTDAAHAALCRDGKPHQRSCGTQLPLVLVRCRVRVRVYVRRIDEKGVRRSSLHGSEEEQER
jgi:hypothetical protein